MQTSLNRNVQRANKFRNKFEGKPQASGHEGPTGQTVKGQQRINIANHAVGTEWTRVNMVTPHLKYLTKTNLGAGRWDEKPTGQTKK